MSAIIALIGPKVIGIMALVLAGLGLAFQQRLAGAKAERNRQKAKEAASEAKARDIKDQVDNDVGALPADIARKELGKWSKD